LDYYALGHPLGVSQGWGGKAISRREMDTVMNRLNRSNYNVATQRGATTATVGGMPKAVVRGDTTKSRTTTTWEWCGTTTKVDGDVTTKSLNYPCS
jgi:hypothetical protein